MRKLRFVSAPLAVVLLVAFAACSCLFLGCTDGGLVATVSNATDSDMQPVSIGAELQEKLPHVIEQRNQRYACNGISLVSDCKNARSSLS